MQNFERQSERDAMVDRQIIARGIYNPRVVEAMRNVPRHCFIPVAGQEQAYEDHPVPIGCGQTISQPYMVAYMTDALALRPEDRVLEIGTGSGYQAAILAGLARAVVTVERHAELVASARTRLADMGYGNVTVICGDGTLGWPDRAPYDAILVTAGSPCVPPALKAQLAQGGRLVCPAGDRHTQQLIRVVRDGDHYSSSESIACVFVPLIGEAAWPPDPD